MLQFQAGERVESRRETQIAEENSYRVVESPRVVDEFTAPRADNGRYRFDASVSCKIMCRGVYPRGTTLLLPLGQMEMFLGLG